MSYIAMLLPREELVRQAQDLVRENPHSVGEIRCIRTEEAVEEAGRSVEAGAGIIIARGLQAMRIEKALNVPVVQVRLTAQELGLLLLKAKHFCTSPRPRIALVAASNMLCDTSCCGMLFGVELRVFSYNVEEGYEQANQNAVAWAPEAIIGGDHTLAAAKQAGIPALFLDFIDDSLREAIRSAETALYANEQNKRANAQFDALLNSTTNGYIQLNEKGLAVKVNAILLDILECTEKDVLGRPLQALIPGIDQTVVEGVLEGGNSYSTFLHIHYQAMVAILAPIRFEDGTVEGAVLSCHKVHRNIQVGPDADFSDLARTGVTERNFDSIHQKSEGMASAVHRAKLFSQSANPVLLVGEQGLEGGLIAQCIHNNSLNRAGPFVQMNCGGLEPGKQMEALFGTGQKREDGETDLGAFGLANNGTLLLLELDKLDKAVQYHVYRALHFHRITQQGLERPVHVNVRLIATTGIDLYSAMKQGTFRDDLYYLLSGLKISIPPLRNRPEDLADILQENFRRICDSLNRYHVLTNGAWELLRHLPWLGNAVQLSSFLERMVLTAKKRTIDEVFVQRLWDDMYPELLPQAEQTAGEPEGYVNPEARKIQEVLEQSGGNRTAAAKVLGISTTTLWRKMKRLGINDRYSK